MASQATNYAVYTTEDEGKTLKFVGEQSAYTRKDAIGKLVASDDVLAARVKGEKVPTPNPEWTGLDDNQDAWLDKDGNPTADRAKAAQVKAAPVSFVIAPVTAFQVVTPKIETKVEVTFG